MALVFNGRGGGGSAFNGGTIHNALDIAGGPSTFGPMLVVDASDLTALPQALEVIGSDGAATTGDILTQAFHGAVLLQTLVANVTPLSIKTPDNPTANRFSIASTPGSDSASLIFDRHGRFGVQCSPTGATICLQVFDAAGDPIFQVNADGSLQGKTGKALTFDL